jgi:hypothetical protein
MAIVALTGLANIDGYLAIVTAEKRFAGSWYRTVTNKTLKEFADGGRCHQCREWDDGGLRSAKRRRIPLVFAALPLTGRK